jgi:vacuolar-type H+-ATPase subunit E/Vma4
MTVALADLLAAIEADAAADIGRLRAEQHHEVAEILADARSRADDLERSAVSAAEREEREAGERRLAAAREAIGGWIREAHEDAYQRIARDARDRLRMVRERAGYPAVMAALLAEARSALPGATVAHVDPADERLARRLLGDEGRLRVAAGLHCAGGVVICDEAGAVVRNTLEDRFAAAEPELRAVIGELLGAADAAPLGDATPGQVPA